MGTCKSKPTKVAPIKLESTKQATEYPNEMDSSLEDTSVASNRKSSGTSSTTQRANSSSRTRVRPLSRVSRKSGKIGGRMYQGMGRISARPISRTDSLNLSGKGDMLRETFNRKKNIQTVSSGLNQSLNSTQRQFSSPDPNPCETSCSSEELCTFLMRTANNNDKVISATTCPCCLSQFGKIVHIPYLLLCGHSYCSSCINIALRNDPSFLKCGICSMNTSVESQSECQDLVQNKDILDLIENKDFLSILNNSIFDRCAECDKEIATTYCSDCSASYCAECNKQQHTGSRVRSKHKPVPMNLKPRPQPTCKKHPGQSCVLYCETDRQPMCVLCKFYGHHKFHNYQLLNNSSSAYKTLLTKKFVQIEKIETSLSKVARGLTDRKREIKDKAVEAQEKLERNFDEIKEELMAALEQREAMLLVLLDQQVQRREEIVQDEQEEIALARARAIAALEEARRLLELNPVSALLARKHVDSVFDTVLKHTASFPDESVDSKDDNRYMHHVGTQLLPLGLRPKEEMSKRMSHILEQHGAILQLPEKPVFKHVKVVKDYILIQWKLNEDTTIVASDRTLSYSLQCFADVPFKFQKDRLFNFNKRFQNIIHPTTTGLSPDSGFQDDRSERSSQASGMGLNLPSLPPTIHSNNNVSLIALQETTSRIHVDHQSNKNIIPEDVNDDVQSTNVRKTASPILEGTGFEAPKKPLTLRKESILTQSIKTSGALLNLPPLLQQKETSTTEDTVSNSDLLSNSNLSRDMGDIETDTPRTRGTLNNDNDSLSTSTSSVTTNATATTTENIVDLGRYCKGYAFEEIYSGKETSFRYSGIIRGATYYFRICCHNAAGQGAWSNTYKCSIQVLSN